MKTLQSALVSPLLRCLTLHYKTYLYLSTMDHQLADPKINYFGSYNKWTTAVTYSIYAVQK